MPSYDYRMFEARDWTDRFPPWAVGASEWREQSRGRAWRGATVRARQTPPRHGMASRPRVFVSHRQIDTAKALRTAWLADNHGFEFWLDVLDPNLQKLQSLVGSRALTPTQLAIAIAQIVEMGLINSTHVLVVMTQNTKGSQWVPYEYGRAKDIRPVTVQAACWVDKGLPQSSLPEYLFLGVQTVSEQDVSNWLSTEFANWKYRYGSTATAPAGNWAGPVPPPL